MYALIIIATINLSVCTLVSPLCLSLSLSLPCLCLSALSLSLSVCSLSLSLSLALFHSFSCLILLYIIGDSSTVNAINEAMQEYENLTCIRFVQRTNQADYINFVKGIGYEKYS